LKNRRKKLMRKMRSRT